MITVHKYSLAPLDRVKVLMPSGAVVLSVQDQNGSAVMWALVDTDQPLIDREFVVIGTGHPIQSPEHLTFIDTFQLRNLDLVFHVFENRKAKAAH